MIRRLTRSARESPVSAISPHGLWLAGIVEHGVILDLVAQVEVGVGERLAPEQAQRAQVA